MTWKDWIKDAKNQHSSLDAQIKIQKYAPSFTLSIKFCTESVPTPTLYEQMPSNSRIICITNFFKLLQQIINKITMIQTP